MKIKNFYNNLRQTGSLMQQKIIWRVPEEYRWAGYEWATGDDGNIVKSTKPNNLINQIYTEITNED